MTKRTLSAKTVTLAHGSGGKAMRDLIEVVFVEGFKNDLLAPLEDQARVQLADLLDIGGQLAITTDSYVVDPIIFPGGNIGTLAVTGTVNDLAVGGAIPRYLTCGMIIEEGFPIDTLRQIVHSMKETADQAGVSIITGDTKVVHKGSADKLFINTAGFGVIPPGIDIRANKAVVEDVVIISGFVGDHGAAIVDARGELALENDILTDCKPLNGLVQEMLQVCPDIHCMRDATRGGIATVLNEFAESSGICIEIDESSIPVRDAVRGMCEILGLDPLYLANEGVLVAVVPKQYAESLLETMRKHEAGANSFVIGAVKEKPTRRVILKTKFGGDRIVDMLVGEQLPRIC